MAAPGGFTLSTAVVLATIAAWPGAPAWAQKTDIVRLANGDHVTGEIENLQRGRLELSTDDAGTIEFEWDNIASIQSTHQFEIGTTDGRRVLARCSQE